MRTRSASVTLGILLAALSFSRVAEGQERGAEASLPTSSTGLASELIQNEIRAALVLDRLQERGATEECQQRTGVRWTRRLQHAAGRGSRGLLVGSGVMVALRDRKAAAALFAAAGVFSGFEQVLEATGDRLLRSCQRGLESQFEEIDWSSSSAFRRSAREQGLYEEVGVIREAVDALEAIEAAKGARRTLPGRGPASTDAETGSPGQRTDGEDSATENSPANEDAWSSQRVADVAGTVNEYLVLAAQAVDALAPLARRLGVDQEDIARVRKGIAFASGAASIIGSLALQNYPGALLSAFGLASSVFGEAGEDPMAGMLRAMDGKLDELLEGQQRILGKLEEVLDELRELRRDLAEFRQRFEEAVADLGEEIRANREVLRTLLSNQQFRHLRAFVAQFEDDYSLRVFLALPTGMIDEVSREIDLLVPVALSDPTVIEESLGQALSAVGDEHGSRYRQVYERWRDRFRSEEDRREHVREKLIELEGFSRGAPAREFDPFWELLDNRLDPLRTVEVARLLARFASAWETLIPDGMGGFEVLASESPLSASEGLWLERTGRQSRLLVRLAFRLLNTLIAQEIVLSEGTAGEGTLDRASLDVLQAQPGALGAVLLWGWVLRGLQQLNWSPLQYAVAFGSRDPFYVRELLGSRVPAGVDFEVRRFSLRERAIDLLQRGGHGSLATQLEEQSASLLAPALPPSGRVEAREALRATLPDTADWLDAETAALGPTQQVGAFELKALLDGAGLGIDPMREAQSAVAESDRQTQGRHEATFVRIRLLEEGVTGEFTDWVALPDPGEVATVGRARIMAGSHGWSGLQELLEARRDVGQALLDHEIAKEVRRELLNTRSMSPAELLGVD